MNTRRYAALGVGLALVVLAVPLAAQPQKAGGPDDAVHKTCISAYEQVQSLRDGGQLIDARDKAIICARDECPKALSKQCADWLDQIAQSTPSVVVGATGPSGQDLTAVRVAVDGKPLSDQLGARAFPVDPGNHTFQFDSSEFGHVDLKVVLREGEKNRRVVATFSRVGPPGVAVSEPTSRPVPPAAWALIGVGGAAAIVGATFEGLGLAQKGRLDTMRCTPNCKPSDVNPMTRDFVVGDVSVAVAVAAGAAALVVVLTRPEVHHTNGASPPTAEFFVAPDPHGGFAVLTGHFF